YTLSVTLAATGHAPPTTADVLGIVSLIFWALMAMVSLKYVVLVLRADNDGEGGILALLSVVESDRIANGPGLPIFVLLGIVGGALLMATAPSRRPFPCSPPSRASSWSHRPSTNSSCR